jgi:hypothetical protein
MPAQLSEQFLSRDPILSIGLIQGGFQFPLQGWRQVNGAFLPRNEDPDLSPFGKRAMLEHHLARDHCAFDDMHVEIVLLQRRGSSRAS